MPDPFGEVAGHQAVRRLLSSQLETARLSHAYLFVGEPSLGKTTIARALAAALRQARANWARVGHADRVAAIDELLVDLYTRQCRHGEALALSSALLAARGCPNDERRLCRLERLAAVLRALGRDDEAAAPEAQAQELRRAIERRGYERERLGDGAPETPTATSCGEARLTGPIFASPLL